MQYTPLLGVNNAELGNIILGYIASTINISDNLSLTQTTAGLARIPLVGWPGNTFSLLGDLVPGHTPIVQQTINDNIVFIQTTRVNYDYDYIVNDALVFFESVLRRHDSNINQTLVFVESVRQFREIEKSLADTLVFSQLITQYKDKSRNIKDHLFFNQTIRVNHSAHYTFHDTLFFLDPYPVTIGYNNTIWLPAIKYQMIDPEIKQFPPCC